MSTTITAAGAEPIRPSLALVESAALSARSRNVVHEILDGPPVITLREAETDTGRLHLLFHDEQAALDAHITHKLASVFTINDTDRASLRFSYVLDGSVDVSLDRTTARRWIVTVDFRKIT